jgi:hypothetical protein
VLTVFAAILVLSLLLFLAPWSGARPDEVAVETAVVEGGAVPSESRSLVGGDGANGAGEAEARARVEAAAVEAEIIAGKQKPLEVNRKRVLTGVIRDAAGRPFPSALVLLSGRSRTRANASGGYRIEFKKRDGDVLDLRAGGGMRPRSSGSGEYPRSRRVSTRASRHIQPAHFSTPHGERGFLRLDRRRNARDTPGLTGPRSPATMDRYHQPGDRRTAPARTARWGRSRPNIHDVRRSSTQAALRYFV